MPKQRLDLLVAEKGLADSRSQAQQLIMAGRVLVNGHVLAKPGHRVNTEVELGLTEAARFVSRGGEKLEPALEAFKVVPDGRVCLDVGASTGGFTDCLLQHGVAKVYAVDVGKGQLHWKLRNDSRVTVMEGVNARYLAAEEFSDPPSLAVVDVSFISLTKVLPAVIEVLSTPCDIIVLIKPQFEAGPRDVGKGGVVRDESVRQEVIGRIRAFVTEAPALAWRGVVESSLRGPAGNVEFLAHVVRESTGR